MKFVLFFFILVGYFMLLLAEKRNESSSNSVPILCLEIYWFDMWFNIVQNGGPMVLHKCLVLATCIRSESI